MDNGEYYETYREKVIIDKGADVKATKYSDFKNILIRVPVAILNEIDVRLAQKPWINRTHWIVEAMFEKLASDEYENH